MSDTAPEAFELPTDPTAAMGALLQFLAPEPDDPAAEPGGAPDAAPAAGGGQPAAAGEGAAAAGAATAAPAAGDGGQPAAAGAGAAPVVVDTSAAGVDAETILPKFDDIATGFETRQTQLLEQQTLTAMRDEYKEYFAALGKHPRLLVGQEVQSLTGAGKERIRDSTDAAEWQAAVKGLIAAEAAGRVEKMREELSDVYATVHGAIDLFRKNTDLIPGSKQFDKELADAFAVAVKDYESRSNGKLIGYSVPVQPIVNAIRAQLKASRATTPATAATAAPAAGVAAPAATQPRADDGRWTGPQAGLASKAGSAGAGGSNEAAGVMGAFFRQNGMVL